MRVAEFIGQRVRARREEIGMTQEEFGRMLEPLLGKAWSRQTVSAAEQGGRAWTGDELAATAKVLETRIAVLLTPPIGISDVEMPSGAKLSAREIAHSSVGPTVVDKLISEMYDDVAALMRDTKVSHDSSGDALARAKRLEDRLATIIGARWAVTMHKDKPEGEQ